MGAGVTGDQADEKQRLVMSDLVSLTYVEDLTPNLQRFVDHLFAGRFVGERCPRCRRVYLPGKGYCPICVVVIAEEDEVEVSDTGCVTGYTVVTPVRYYGQRATEPFVVASVLLDGSDTPLGQQDIVGVPHEQLRRGLRVRAVWRPVQERDLDGFNNRGSMGTSGIVAAFTPTGEADAALDSLKGNIR
jgi:uncharacterized OB-fold protein